MKAVTFDVSVTRRLLAGTLGRLTDSALFGALSGVSFGEVAEPPLPGDRWVSLDVILAGICGADLDALTFSASFLAEAVGSSPWVPGHEILARVREVGSGVTRVRPGRRVVVDPAISCAMRGYGDTPCPSCAAGSPAICERAGEEGALKVGGRSLAPGRFVGSHPDLPGGWGRRVIAHESQLFPAGGGLDDRTAVLVEPLSVGVHAALRARPEEGEPVLVVGDGPMALGTIWALRETGFRGRLVARTGNERGAELARALGATDTVAPGPGSGKAPIPDPARVYRPGVGAEVYGTERWKGEERHTFEVTRELLTNTRAPVGAIVTHVFPLDQYRDALSAAAHPERSEAVRVLLEP